MTKEEFSSKFGISPGNPLAEAAYQSYLSGMQIPGNGISPGRPVYEQFLDAAREGQKKTDEADAEAARLKAPPIDERYKQLVEGQRKQAEQFRNNIPRVADTFMGQIAEVNKKALANEIDQTRKGYNERGLLFSSAREGAEGAAKTRSAQDLAQKRADVNTELYGQADSLDDQAISSGLNLASQGQQLGNAETEMQGNYLDMALKKQQQDMAGIGAAARGAGEGLGYLGGYYGNKSKGTGGYETTNPTNYGADLTTRSQGLT